MKNKLNKRKKLIKKLITDLIKHYTKNDLLNLKTKIIIKNDFTRQNNSNYYKKWTNRDNGVIVKEILKINLKVIKHRSKIGITDNYYKGRRNRLFFMINNYKLSFYTIILHEIGHLVLSHNLIDGLTNTEYNADTFAINELKRLKLLK